MAARWNMRAVILAAALLAAGCREATEVVVVVDSDLRPGLDFDQINFVLFSVNPNGFPGNNSGIPVAQGFALPATLGVVPQQGGPSVFDIMAVAARNVTNTPIVSRRVSNVAFVPDERRALFISLLAQCRCNGTNCDIDPPCNDIVNPQLTEFDEDNLPRLPRP
jgi:hypothetical protein